MDRAAPATRPVVVVLALVAGLVAIASASGVFLRGDLAATPFTTVRGDVVDSLIGGIYRFNGKAVAAEGVGWDLVTLFLVVPALLVTLPFVRRRSLRATLLTMGVLAYFLYQYVEYAVFLAYGPMFPVYVAIVGLSVSGLGLLLGEVDVAALPSRFSERFPRRAAIGFGGFMAVLLLALWLPLIARTWGATQVPQLEGGVTFVIQAFDLGLLVPLGIFTAATVYRRLPVGYLLASIVIVKGMAMGAGIAAMLLVEAAATGAVQVVPIGIFALTSAIGAAIAWRLYGSIEPAETDRGTVAPWARSSG
jgi:hypothetical protein